MTNRTVKTYSNGEITIVWEPGKCTHSGMCVKSLPQVYNPQAKPWITIENASTKQLKEQLSKCPSGALSYFPNSDSKSPGNNQKTGA